MRMRALILTVMAAALLIAPASPQDKGNPPPKNPIEESAKKIKELHKERIAVLKDLVDLSTKLFYATRASYGEVLEAELQLLQAELDAAEKESERITIYKDFLDRMKKCQQAAEAQHQAGRATMLPILTFKARRLEAEINLERAKAKEAKAK